MKVKDILDTKGYNYLDTDPVSKILDYKVVEEIGYEHSLFKSKPFSHKYVFVWWIVEKGNKRYAMGWNENPAIGWSFPVKRYRTDIN